MTGITDFWCDIETTRDPTTGHRIWLIGMDPWAKSDAFVLIDPVTYGYLRDGKPHIRVTPPWFHFSPSTPGPVSRMIHDTREGGHIAMSAFHDDEYNELDEDTPLPLGFMKEMSPRELIDNWETYLTDDYLAAVLALPEDAKIILENRPTREEADELWQAVGVHYKANQADERITYRGLRLFGGMFHKLTSWFKKS